MARFTGLFLALLLTFPFTLAQERRGGIRAPATHPEVGRGHIPAHGPHPARGPERISPQAPNFRNRPGYPNAPHEELGVSRPEIESAIAEENRELKRRERVYRGDRPPTNIRGRTAILIDDGLATGSSMRAAIEAVRKRRPAKVVAAVLVASEDACEQLERDANEVVCAVTPPVFFAVGQWYQEFRQTTDHEVRQLLDRAAARRMPRAA